MFITGDQFSKNGTMHTILVVLSIVGLYDIMEEIMNENYIYFSQNFMKKLLVFSALYLKTESVHTASLLSIIIILAFPKVFSGGFTSSRDKSKQP